MKKHIAVLSLLAVIIPAGAQTTATPKRIVCDGVCRVEYQKTEPVKPRPAAPAPAATAPKTITTKTTTTKTTTTSPTVPTPTTVAEPLYAVVSPVGRSDVALINQAPRLETLDGKTIAVVGVSFMTGITLPEIPYKGKVTCLYCSKET